MTTADATTELPTNTPIRGHGRLWSNLKEVCDLLGLHISDNVAEELLFQHVQYKAGQRVYTIGQACDTLYVVNSGFLKSVLIDDFGNEQVLGFPMKGDVLGVDSLHTLQTNTEAVALSDCDLILVSFKKVRALARMHLQLESVLYHMMSRELVRKHTIISMLGSLSAEARVARFLAQTADRFEAMGYSAKLFNLRMTRAEIGNYLGLTLETVSRTMSHFVNAGYITVDHRTIGVKDLMALKTLRRLPAGTNRKQSRRL